MTLLRHLLAGLCCTLGAVSLTVGWYLAPILWGVSWWWAPVIVAGGVGCLWVVQWLEETV